MIIVKGQGATATELPLDRAAARAYFEDVPAFLTKIEAVATVKPLGRPGAYLVLHHPMGGLGYSVVMAACCQVTWHEGGMHLRPLDFDAEQVKSEHPVVKGYIQSDLRLAERPADATWADFSFEVTVEVPVPGLLALVPRGLLQATADGIMQLRAGMVVESLFRQVLADFELPSGIRA